MGFLMICIFTPWVEEKNLRVLLRSLCIEQPICLAGCGPQQRTHFAGSLRLLNIEMFRGDQHNVRIWACDYSRYGCDHMTGSEEIEAYAFLHEGIRL